MTRRLLFVGDVQGCREELEQLLEELRFDPAGDELHPVGDFVNRGPDSLGTLRLLRSLDAGGVLGNHDLHLLQVAAGRRALGARDTFQDVLDAPDREELLHWLAARPFARAFEGLLLVHAGVHPRWRDVLRELAGKDPLAPDAAVDFVTRARYCTPDGDLPASDWPPPPPPYAPWFEHWPGEREGALTVVFGHWARLGLVVRPLVRGLDTGCVYGGRLTAWIPAEDRFASVKAARAWSPVASE